MGKVIVKPCGTGYEVEVWLRNTEKSTNERYFDTIQEAIDDANRIMEGLRLPSEALYICCNKNSITVPGYWSRGLHIVIAYKNDCVEKDERVFYALRHAREYAEKLTKEFGDRDNWVSELHIDDDSVWTNDHLGIKIILSHKTVLWPDCISEGLAV